MAKIVPLPVLSPLSRRCSTPGQDSQKQGGAGYEAYEKKEKCGVVGVWGGPGAAHLCYMGLYAQQHRGQESAGIAVSDGAHIVGHTGMGLVGDVFDTSIIAALDAAGPRDATPPVSGSTHGGPGSSSGGAGVGVGVGGAIGHNRYSTAGGSLACNAQPLVESYIGGQVAIAHNGNLINAELLRAWFEQAGHLFHTTSDTEVVIHLLASPAQQKSGDALAATLRHLQGAFSLVMLFPDRIEAARDPWGWRPLTLGRLADGRYVVASETIALDVMGAQVVRDVEPGEIVTLSDKGVSSRRYAEPAPRLAQCVFEHVYFANPASIVFGQNVQVARESMGERLALEAPVEADLVVPMPDSGRSAGIGYARASGIAYREAIVPNRYVGRTFIKPTQAERNAAVRLKLNVIREVVAGKRVIVVDDSVVRGTTTRAKIQQIREAGAREIHLRISCPPIRNPCYFGVDFASREQLIAHGRSTEQIAEFLGVDSLHFLSLEGLLACMTRPAPQYCAACFTGEYRLDPDKPEMQEEVLRGQMPMF